MSFEHGKSTTVTTPKGTLRGYKQNDVYHFCGIEYGKAERFQPAKEIEPWSGVKEATNYGYTCPPFLPDTTGNTLKSPHRFWINNEDCLNLNVWTRSINSDVRKPVLVWFHGGGFNNGSALDLYAFDGCNIADKGDVVVVNINHRLNVLGYLDLRAFGEKYKYSANVGNWDLICALKWVQENIECFGGDKNNVTIFGQSGGGGKTISVMNMPASAGLYHKAMVMSGVTANLMKPQDITPTDIIKHFMEMCEMNDVSELETIPQRALADGYIASYKDLGGKGMPRLAPSKGWDFIGDPSENGFTEYAKNTPMMIGSNFSEFCNLPKQYVRCEMSDEEMTQALEKELGKEIADAVIPAFLRKFPDKKIIDILQYDAAAFRQGTKEFFKKRLEEGCAPTYEYMFSPTIGINDGSMPQHNSDISYFYYNTDFVPSNDIGEATKVLEGYMSGCLVNFAYTGVPSAEGLCKWEPATMENSPTMVFDRDSRIEYGLDDEFLDLLVKSGFYAFKI